MSKTSDQHGANLKKEFYKGLNAALDPLNEDITTGEAITTLRSHWLHLLCSVCGHTFRPDDPVHIDEHRVARHAGSVLGCAKEQPHEAASGAEIEDFFRGLHQGRPRHTQAAGERLAGKHPLLAPPRNGFKRHTCAVCGHTLRPGDTVVTCPCRPGQPMCLVAIHRDPVRGLNCWSVWNPGVVQKYCPATCRELDQ